MKLEVSLTEVKDIFKEIQENPGNIFEFIRTGVNDSVGKYISYLILLEFNKFIVRKPYERTEGESNHRNGTYERNFTMKGIGDVTVRVQRDRNAEFKTKILPRNKQYEDSIRQDLSIMYLTGINTRTLAMMSKRLIGRSVSSQEVSNSSKCLIEAVENWRNRDLSGESIKYLFIDGVNFSMRLGNSVESVPFLVVIGVNQEGYKMVLGIQSGNKESAKSWREFFKDLKKRGLKAENITLGVMDGLTGLERVFKEEFSNAKIQRCQVHVTRNVLAKVPRKFNSEVHEDIKYIFYASSKNNAIKLFNEFSEKWKKEIPSAVKCFKKSINSCLTFFNFPQNEWSSIRTTNIIERLHKEFKRRTKSMEIVAGENACYTILAFISLKMELTWKTNPIGNVRKNLPFFENYLNYNFTQKS